jgi:hypothetical protein
MNTTTLIAITSFVAATIVEHSYLLLEEYSFLTIENQLYIKNDELPRAEKSYVSIK